MIRVAIAYVGMIFITTSCSSKIENSSDNAAIGQNSQSQFGENELAGASASANSVVGKKSNVGDAPIYVAKFKNDRRPVPDMLSDGVLAVENGCAVVKLSKHSDGGAMTAVFPKNVMLKSKGGHLVSASFDGQMLVFDRPIRIPGGPLGRDDGSNLGQLLPAFCPNKLFGLGG